MAAKKRRRKARKTRKTHKTRKTTAKKMTPALKRRIRKSAMAILKATK